MDICFCCVESFFFWESGTGGEEYVCKLTTSIIFLDQKRSKEREIDKFEGQTGSSVISLIHHFDGFHDVYESPPHQTSPNLAGRTLQLWETCREHLKWNEACKSSTHHHDMLDVPRSSSDEMFVRCESFEWKRHFESNNLWGWCCFVNICVWNVAQSSAGGRFCSQNPSCLEVLSGVENLNPSSPTR